MKKINKLIIWFIGLSILWWAVYASYTYNNVRYQDWTIQKLPWGWSGWWTHDSYHDIGSTAAWDSTRFTGTKWTNNVITDTRTWLMWESVPSSWSTTMTWEAAKTHCANIDKWWFSDWRLPNIRELISIVDYSRTDGSNYWYNSKFTLEAFNYWSSTTIAADTFLARTLGFSTANTSNLVKTNSYRVICTR